MKRIGIAALVALVALGAVTTGARATQGIYGTYWHPNDTEGDGYGFGFRSQVRVSPFISFDTRASWVKFKDDDLNIIPVEGTMMLKLGMVYAGAGVGYYFFDSNSKIDLANNFGWYALAGIDVAVGPVGLFGEVKWLSLSTDINNVDPAIPNAPTSLEADGLGFNLGVMFGASKP